MPWRAMVTVAMKRIHLNEHNHQEVIQAAIEVLQAGGLIIYPTETCYGIGADATNQEAIDSLMAYKTKRKDKPISVAVTGEEMAAEYVDINGAARNMYDNFLPGPITVVSRGKGKLADGVESSMGTQGIRVPDYPFVLELLAQYGKPITATSANASYKKTPYTIEDILNNTTEKQQALVGLAIDAGELPRRKPSTVVDTTLDNIYIVREGDLELEGARVVDSHSVEDSQRFITRLFHEELAGVVGKRNIVFLLQGDLGAGKTHLSKFIATELGVKDVVVSPTFAICNEYPGEVDGTPLTFYHMDTYRMYEASEINELRPERIFAAPNVVSIEWANKFTDELQQYIQDSVIVTISITVRGEHERRFQHTVSGLDASKNKQND